LLLHVTVDRGISDSTAVSAAKSPLEAPVFVIDARRSKLLLEGTTSSALHESALLQLATEHFDTFETRSNFTPGVILAANWDSASSRLLYTIAAMQSAHAEMRDDAIEIRGVTANIDMFNARLGFLQEELGPDTTIVTDVVSVATAASQDVLCRRAFAQLVREPLVFKQSSAEIRNVSFGTLDRIIEFAYDCPQTVIAITGHTDASGDETWNKRLSVARAQAVANRLVEGGIDPRRLSVNGLGSSQPIADNSTSQGRGQNRRIEFSLL
jgi:OOP family OmpA-OmpF porin